MFDSWGRVVADSMCVGLPSLVFNVSGSPEVGEAPIKCNPHDPKEIRELFESILFDKKVRETLGLMGRTEAISKTVKHRGDLAKFLLEAL
jgi:glycosyltransferase involved in cell wall biosynthesis